MKVFQFYIIALILLALLNCATTKMQFRNNTPFSKAYNLQPTDFALIYDDEIFNSENFVDSVNLYSIFDAINSSYSTDEKYIWKGGFYLNINGIKLKISYYGNFFKDISTGTVYVINNDYANDYNSFRNMVNSTKIKPYRNRKNEN